MKELNLPLKECCFELSTIRNRNLITEVQQKILRDTVVGFFGLSVGSHAALTWMMQSRADSIKIIDPDEIEPSNLNRLRYGWDTIGKYKADVVEAQLYEINPYTKVCKSIHTQYEAVHQLFDTDPKIELVVDEIDDIAGKKLLRELARERKIPLISAVDVGDNVIVDIERYDITPQPDFFLGRIPNIDRINFAHLSASKKRKLIIQLVGFGQNSESMLDSLLAIGKTISTWPQLGATATISGGVITTVLKKILLGENIASGRYFLSLDDIFVRDFNSEKRIIERQRKIAEIKKVFSLQ